MAVSDYRRGYSGTDQQLVFGPVAGQYAAVVHLTEPWFIREWACVAFPGQSGTLNLSVRTCTFDAYHSGLTERFTIAVRGHKEQAKVEVDFAAGLWVAVYCTGVSGITDASLYLGMVRS